MNHAFGLRPKGPTRGREDFIETVLVQNKNPARRHENSGPHFSGSEPLFLLNSFSISPKSLSDLEGLKWKVKRKT